MNGRVEAFVIHIALTMVFVCGACFCSDAFAATEIVRYVNTASAGGDGTTNGTAGGTAAYASCQAAITAEVTARANLVSRDEQLTIYAEGATADSTVCTIDGFTTDSTRFVKFLGNNTAAGTHAGVFSTSQYRITTGTGTANYRSLIIKDDYTQVSGIQLEKVNQAGTMADRWVAVRVSNIAAGAVVLDRILVKGSLTAQSDAKTAVHCEVSAGECRITNAIIYDWTHSGSPSNVQAFESTGSGQMSVYNATIQNAPKGIVCNSTLRIRNTVFQDVTTETSGTCDTANSSNNLTDTATDLPGTSDVTSTVLTFANKASDDFHLDASDSAAIGAGVALDSIFTSDIDGTGNRGVSGWDIGADEQSGGGASNLVDIDAEVTTGCSTGKEDACWVANGFGTGEAADAPGCAIVQGSSAAEGSGYIRCRGTANGTGVGYSEVSFTGKQHARMRFYVRFADGFTTYNVGGHGPGIQGHGDGACSEPGTLELRQSWPYAYNSGSCASAHDAYPTDTGLPQLKNNKWYMFEEYVAADTDGTDGIQKLWIDGTLYIDKTNVNWGGSANNTVFDRIWGPRMYYHARWPDWIPAIDFDGFVVTGSDAGDPGTIGASASQNSLGTADTTGPEYVQVSAEAWAGKHFAGDCSTPSAYLGTSIGQEFRSGDNGDVTLDSTHTNNAFDFSDGCTGTNRALKSNITGGSGGGAGVYWDVPKQVDYGYYWRDWVINTYVYLPSTNDYSTKPPLFGAVGYDGAPGSWGDYVAFTIGSDNKPAIVDRLYSTSATQQNVATAASAITLDAWHKIELQIHNDQTVDLYVDGVKVVDNASLTYNPTWLFASPSSPKIVAGVINYTDTEDFAYWLDDTRIGSVSFDTCDNWDAASCPTELGGSEPTDYNCPECACGVSKR